jgi:hypothetical protein
MNPLFISSLFDVGMKMIERFFPDPAAAADAKLKLLEMQQNGDLKQLAADVQLATGQLEVNKAEAQSTDPFRAGWRPFIGWVCGLGLAFQFVVRPLANWTLAINGYTVFLPGLEMETLMTLLFGMLGLGAYRTKEKIEGVK